MTVVGESRTRRLLAAILACLLFLVVRNLWRGDAGRYVVTPWRDGGVPVLIRTDTATGDSAKLELRAGGDHWVSIAAPGSTPGALALQRPAASEDDRGRPRPLASDEIKALANAILGDELTPDVRMWAVGQLAVTEDRRATLALIQLLEVVDEPPLVALVREALASRDDPRARQALERHARAEGGS